MARVALAIAAADPLDWRWVLLVQQLMLRTGLRNGQVIEKIKEMA